MINVRFLLALFLAATLHAEEIFVQTASHERFLLQFEEMTLTDLDLLLKELDCEPFEEAPSKGRDASHELTPAEVNDITYLIKSLADLSYPTLLLRIGEMNAIKARIIHIHPYVFLGFIFSVEELKVRMKAIRGKSPVWKEFVGGLSDKMKEEASLGNLTDPMLEDFALKTDYDAEALAPFVKAGRYEDFLKFLIEHMKRTGEPDRYDL